MQNLSQRDRLPTVSTCRSQAWLLNRAVSVATPTLIRTPKESEGCDGFLQDRSTPVESDSFQTDAFLVKLARALWKLG